MTPRITTLRCVPDDGRPDWLIEVAMHAHRWGRRETAKEGA